MSQNRCALHTKKFLKIPFTYLIFQFGQIKIQGQADTCLFSTKKWPFHTKYLVKIRVSELSAIFFFAPIVYDTAYTVIQYSAVVDYTAGSVLE